MCGDGSFSAIARVLLFRLHRRLARCPSNEVCLEPSVSHAAHATMITWAQSSPEIVPFQHQHSACSRIATAMGALALSVMQQVIAIGEKTAAVDQSALPAQALARGAIRLKRTVRLL